MVDLPSPTKAKKARDESQRLEDDMDAVLGPQQVKLSTMGVGNPTVRDNNNGESSQTMRLRPTTSDRRQGSVYSSLPRDQSPYISTKEGKQPAQRRQSQAASAPSTSGRSISGQSISGQPLMPSPNNMANIGMPMGDPMQVMISMMASMMNPAMGQMHPDDIAKMQAMMNISGFANMMNQMQAQARAQAQAEMQVQMQAHQAGMTHVDPRFVQVQQERMSRAMRDFYEAASMQPPPMPSSMPQQPLPMPQPPMPQQQSEERPAKRSRSRRNKALVEPQKIVAPAGWRMTPYNEAKAAKLAKEKQMQAMLAPTGPVPIGKMKEATYSPSPALRPVSVRKESLIALPVPGPESVSSAISPHQKENLEKLGAHGLIKPSSAYLASRKYRQEKRLSQRDLQEANKNPRIAPAESDTSALSENVGRRIADQDPAVSIPASDAAAVPIDLKGKGREQPAPPVFAPSRRRAIRGYSLPSPDKETFEDTDLLPVGQAPSMSGSGTSVTNTPDRVLTSIENDNLPATEKPKVRRQGLIAQSMREQHDALERWGPAPVAPFSRSTGEIFELKPVKGKKRRNTSSTELAPPAKRATLGSSKRKRNGNGQFSKEAAVQAVEVGSEATTAVDEVQTEIVEKESSQESSIRVSNGRSSQGNDLSEAANSEVDQVIADSKS